MLVRPPFTSLHLTWKVMEGVRGGAEGVQLSQESRD